MLIQLRIISLIFSAALNTQSNFFSSTRTCSGIRGAHVRPRVHVDAFPLRHASKCRYQVPVLTWWRGARGYLLVWVTGWREPAPEAERKTPIKVKLGGNYHMLIFCWSSFSLFYGPHLLWHHYSKSRQNSFFSNQCYKIIFLSCFFLFSPRF